MVTTGERSFHLNVLELTAVEYASKSFEVDVPGKRVEILTANTCAVYFLRKIGGSHSSEFNAWHTGFGPGVRTGICGQQFPMFKVGSM